MTPELIGILAMSATLAGLIVAIWRDGRAHTDRGLAELRADNQRLREEVRAENHALRAEFQNFREEVNAGNRALRAEVHADNQRLRQDVQALAERTARLEGAIQGLFTNRTDPDRRDDAA